MKDNTLTIFYDGNCPLCCLEMQKLKRHDSNNMIVLENLHQENFSTLFPEINSNDALEILHGQYQGKTLFALDVTHRAWTLVGKGILVAPLKFPIIKQLAHICYLFIAKYRQAISSFVYKRFGIGIKNCNKGICYEQKNNTNHWG
jgi:predicted DCC family thiol-disulfide oxidoreductase YuxK